VNRIMAAAIELNNDEKGIIWPLELAPFQVTIIPLNYGKENIRSATDELYNSLESSGIEVLLDDRNESAGIKFNDAELIGTPFIIVIGDRGLKKGIVEVKTRKTGNTIELKIEEIKEKLPALIV